MKINLINLAREVAEESIVLLKNDGILPLNKEKIKTIGVIGPNANSRRSLDGNYHGTASRYITALEGIQDYVGEDIRVLYSVGCELSSEKSEVLSAKPYDRISEALSVADYCDVIVLWGWMKHLRGKRDIREMPIFQVIRKIFYCQSHSKYCWMHF